MGETAKQAWERQRAAAIEAGVATAAGLGVEALEQAAPEAAKVVESVAAAVAGATAKPKAKKAKR